MKTVSLHETHCLMKTVSLMNTHCLYAESTDNVEEAEVDCHELMQPLRSTDDESVEDIIILLPHQKCASHILNLVGCNALTLSAGCNATSSLRHSMDSTHIFSSHIFL